MLRCVGLKRFYTNTFVFLPSLAQPFFWKNFICHYIALKHTQNTRKTHAKHTQNTRKTHAKHENLNHP